MKKIYAFMAALVLSISSLSASQIALEDLNLNYAQGVYLSTYYSVDYHVWKVDLVSVVSGNEYDCWLSLAFETSSYNAIAGTYSIADMIWADMELVDGADTSVVEFINGSVTITPVDNSMTYNIVINATDIDGNQFTLNSNFTFRWFYDLQTDVDITMNESGESQGGDSGSGSAAVVLQDLDINYAQGIYLSNYFSVSYPAWEIDLVEFVDQKNYDVWLSFAIFTSSATSIAGSYDIADMGWATIDIVNGSDTTKTNLVSGTLTLTREADYSGYAVYHVVINAQDANGNAYTLESDIIFDYFYDAKSDEDIEITDNIGSGLEVVDAHDFVRVAGDNLIVDAQNGVQIYNLSGQLLYNGIGGTISNISRGQTLIIRADNQAAKVVF